MTERPGFLAMLAEADRNAGAPPRVEQALRAKVRQQQQLPGQGARTGILKQWPVWKAAAAGIAAIAAAVMLVVFGYGRLFPVSAQIAELALPARFAPEVPDVELARMPVPRSAVPPQALNEYGERRRAKNPSAPAPTRTFYALAYAPPELLENGRMVRVRVPRAALLSFGLPLDAYRPAAGKVDADVIFTEDGIARAIRFVSQ